MITTDERDELYRIYCTVDNLEDECDKSDECWADISNLKYGSRQKPYKPYKGDSFNGLMFVGINLNGGNDSNCAIDELVNIAKKDYLEYGKYRIFKKKDYGGSPFYYYIPLLSYLYMEYFENKITTNSENKLTNREIISGFEYCGITNLIKCSVNSPDGRSTPSESMYKNCVRKFMQELQTTKSEIMVLFTFFKYPTLVSEHFKNSEILLENERRRIQKHQDLLILELEHPLSTKTTREQKYRSYSKALYDLVEIKKKRI